MCRRRASLVHRAWRLAQVTAGADYGVVTLLRAVPVPARPAAALEPVIGGERYAHLLAGAARFRDLLAGRTVWTVNSTAAGGGVAEMLQALVGYVADLDIPIRWMVIGGDSDFFAITKRLHNQLHGVGGQHLGDAEAEHYQRVLAANSAELLGLVRPGDIVLLHDPQTAGLTAPLAQAGIPVVWRCHVGVDWHNSATRAAWKFLRPHIASAHGFVFSRRNYVPSWVPEELTWIIPPSIDPFSAKNQQLDADTVGAILATIGVLDHSSPQVPTRFVRRDGTTGEVTRSALVTCDGLPGPGDQVVVQISRWDWLKDMGGVMRGFADHVVPGGAGFLVLAGPPTDGVSDDPEGALVYSECVAQWRALPAATRARVLLALLPLDDVDENAAMVNALQRHAALITQKSLAEGFGLTVAEAMWKGRAVIGSAVGGIVDQIGHGIGVLLRDPRDLEAFGSQVRRLLDHPDIAERMGLAGQAHVREHYLGDIHLLHYARLFDTVLSRAQT
jgi:trehalose synthase